jgi:hypothetical protein
MRSGIARVARCSFPKAQRPFQPPPKAVGWNNAKSGRSEDCPFRGCGQVD